jgi:Reverse transcriptase (RNA-dependent DNA polymerase)
VRAQVRVSAPPDAAHRRQQHSQPPHPSDRPPPAPDPALPADPAPQHQPGPGWQRQLHNWDQVAQKFNLTDNRYNEFRYLCFLDIDNEDVVNYANFHLGLAEPSFKHRLSRHWRFWTTLNTPEWLLELIKHGVTVPFITMPTEINLSNNRSVLQPEKVPEVQKILTEYLAYGFIEKVDYKPWCVMPLQLKETSDKIALIYDMTRLNDYVEKSKFKLESWPEMVNYAAPVNFGIKFDLKKFYHEIDINLSFQKYFRFCYEQTPGNKSYFVWKTIPYGYTRAPFIASQLLKPLISKWRKLGVYTVVFYDDGMAVAADKGFLEKIAIQMQTDLIKAGLVPGVNKCVWDPVQNVDWIMGCILICGYKAIVLKIRG